MLSLQKALPIRSQESSPMPPRVLLILATLLLFAGGAYAATGELEITVTDGDTGEILAARIADVIIESGAVEETRLVAAAYAARAKRALSELPESLARRALEAVIDSAIGRIR